MSNPEVTERLRATRSAVRLAFSRNHDLPITDRAVMLRCAVVLSAKALRAALR